MQFAETTKWTVIEEQSLGSQRCIHVMLYLGTHSCISGKCGNLSKSLMLILLCCVLLLLCGAEEHTFPFHPWTRRKTCTLLPPVESLPSSQPPACSSHPVQVGPKDRRHIRQLPGACKKWAPLPIYSRDSSLPYPHQPRHYSEQWAPLPLTFPSSPSLHWVGRKIQHGVIGNCLSTQEQDAKTSSAGLPGWTSQEHGFPRKQQHHMHKTGVWCITAVISDKKSSSASPNHRHP